LFGRVPPEVRELPVFRQSFVHSVHHLEDDERPSNGTRETTHEGQDSNDDMTCHSEGISSDFLLSRLVLSPNNQQPIKETGP
jgi:hypothetical protein